MRVAQAVVVVSMVLMVAMSGSVAFALGWYMRGDAIYSKMFASSAEIVGSLPMVGGKR